DAVDMALPVGAVRIVPPERIEDCGIGTHALPLTALIAFIGDDAGEVIVVGIQPESLDSKEGLSPAVRQGANALVVMIREGRVREIPVLEEDGVRSPEK
ncbi:MAG TPA: hydrogenase maturation protease, partial [Methanofollis liminatans]|nr:hydrogenase maturation protease [Methanofollis liminatans]